MNAIELYIEKIIIGMETLSWIILIFLLFVNELSSLFLNYCISNFFLFVLLMGVCIILGVITDVLSDKIFEDRRKKAKQKYMIKYSISLLIWEKCGLGKYAGFILLKIKIARSTVLNSMIISILGTCFAFIHYKIQLAILILAIFLAITIISDFSHKLLLEKYYKETSLLYNNTFKNKNRKKK